MKKFQVLVISFVLWQSFSSCYQMAFKSMGVYEDTVSLKSASCSNKKIVYLPMHHIGERVFYESVKNKIDSLREAGYMIYFEGVWFSRTYDSLRNDTLAMKLRRITSVDFRALKTNGGYIDTVNNSFLGIKMKQIAKYDLVNQPSFKILLDTTKDRRVDAYLSDAIPAFEKKYGEIILTDCDFSTKQGEKYQCKRDKKRKEKKFILLEYRNNLIANEILKDEHTKIALVYGAKHFEGIMTSLKNQDSTWKVHK